MISKELKLVIFDKDGLIMNTEAPVFQVWSDVFEEWDVKPFNKDIYIKFVGSGRDKNLDLMKELYPYVKAEDLFDACSAKVREYIACNDIEIMPGLIELLDHLDEKGIRKCVATSSRKPNAIITLEKCNMLHRFDEVISGNMVERTKPAPDLFLKAVEIFKVNPRDCLVLEDSIAGIEAAVAASIPAIAIPDMVPIPEDIVKLCEYVCKSLNEVIGLI